jgi:hypothetical protein
MILDACPGNAEALSRWEASQRTEALPANHCRPDALRVNPEGPTLCRQSHSEDETALGHNRPDQKASALKTSPPARVPSAFQIERLMLLLMNRTEPSMSRTFTPPGWNELAAMNESMTP